MIQCKLLFNKNTSRIRLHEYQPVFGFCSLKKQGVLSLEIDYNSNAYIPLANAFCCEINGRRVYYDVEDGTDNLSQSFIDYIHQNNIILFKRAYDEDFYKNDALIRPYGFNYGVLINSPFDRLIFPLFRKELFSTWIFNILLSMRNKWSMIDNLCNHTNGILCYTRLWDQKNTHSPVEGLNETRITVIRELRRVFHGNVIAGVADSPLSRKMCKDLILSHKITNRHNYLQLVKKTSVCITTTGLHDSTGWRFGEFVACGKAIVSEPLFFAVPGLFCEGKNYLPFSTTEQLIDNCDFLLSHPEERKKIEHNNINYYFHYLRPDVLIWNTIRQVIDA